LDEYLALRILKGMLQARLLDQSALQAGPKRPESSFSAPRGALVWKEHLLSYIAFSVSVLAGLALVLKPESSLVAMAGDLSVVTWFDREEILC
jgi:hypothetical protein